MKNTCNFQIIQYIIKKIDYHFHYKMKRFIYSLFHFFITQTLQKYIICYITNITPIINLIKYL
jgi:deoxycytidylate deaminase